MSFGDLLESAGWRSMPLGHAQYMASTPVAQRSPWLQVRGFSIETLLDDWMHNMYLGMAGLGCQYCCFPLYLGMAEEGLCGRRSLRKRVCGLRIASLRNI